MPKEGPIVREKPVRRPGARRQALMIVIIVAVLGAMLGAAYIIFKPQGDTYTLETYTYAEVKEGAIIETIQLSGTLTVEYSENILSPQAGVVTDIYFGQGDEIEVGQIVAKINPEKLESQLKEKLFLLKKKQLDTQKKTRERELEIEKLEASRRNLENELENAKFGLERAETLYKAGTLSKEELDKAEDRRTQAERALEDLDRQEETAELNYEYSMNILKMDIDSLEEDIEELKNEIEECAIRAPLSGKVMNVYVSGGDSVAQFGKILRAADLSRPVVNVKVPENKISSLYTEQPVTLSLGNNEYLGRINTIAMEAESTGEYESTVSVTIAFEEIPGNIVPGSTAAAEIIIGQIEETPFLPRGPYLTTGNQLYLYRIEGNKAHRIEVNFGTITSNKVQVVSGVDIGDRIIISGYQDFITYKEININKSGGNKTEVKE